MSSGGKPLAFIIQRNRLRGESLALDRFREEGLGSSHIAPGAEPKIDRLASPVNCTVKIDPLASDLHVRFVDSPRLTSCRGKAVPAFDELRREALHPAHDRRMRQRQPALGHHLDQVAEAELVARVPAHAQDDDLAIEMQTVERLVDALPLANASPSTR